jgi:pyrimidine-nucleoside phosphorylase
VDKHSTGGVGDKTSLILAPLVAACGGIVPMMSGRGLGHTGGTLDKLESIPGFRANLTEPELRESLRTVGIGLIGQTGEVAPADKKLYALRDVTGTVESMPLITASILSKKLAEGIDALVMDVKFGRGAFMQKYSDAKALAQLIVNVGIANNLKTEALLTDMNCPLGATVGNSLEVIECIEILKGKVSSPLTDLSMLLAARMLRITGLAVNEEDAVNRLQRVLSNGQALEKLRQTIEKQGGDPRVIDDYSRFPMASKTTFLKAPQSGYVHAIDAWNIGRGTMILGAGRSRAEDQIDHGVGVRLKKQVGDALQAGDDWLEIIHREDSVPRQALDLFQSALEIFSEPPTQVALIKEIIS